MRNTTLFFHPELNGPKKSRCTFAISPERDKEGTLIALHTGVALCSNDDQFVKREGRTIALSNPPQSLSLRQLPQYVADVMNKHQKHTYYTWQDFAWLSLLFI